MQRIGIKGFPVSQNGQDFIIGKAKIGEILSYTRYTERVIIGFDEVEKPIYNEHIQRKVEKSRVDKIADFLIAIKIDTGSEIDIGIMNRLSKACKPYGKEKV